MSKQRKKPKKKKNRALAVMGFLEVVFTMIIIVMVSVGFTYFFCNLKSCKMEGTELYDEAYFQELVTDCRYPGNTIYVFGKNLLYPVKDVPFIEEVKVKLTGLNELTVVVKEKDIMGYVYSADGDIVYYDYDGLITDISPRFIKSYLKVEGVICQDPVVGQPVDLDNDNINYLMNLSRLLEKYELAPDYVEFDEKSNATMHFPTYDIKLGKSNYLEDKMARLPYVLISIEEYSGTLHLENFTLDNTDIVFEKSE